jgi:hypothetical protein
MSRSENSLTVSLRLMNARGPHCELSGLILVSKTELDINKVCNTMIWNISNIYLKVITEGHEEFASK